MSADHDLPMNNFDPSISVAEQDAASGYQAERFEHSGDAPRDLRWEDVEHHSTVIQITRRRDDRRVLISSFETVLLGYAEVRDFGSDRQAWWERNDHERQITAWANLQIAELRAGRVPPRARQSIAIIAPEFIEASRTGARLDIRRLHAPEGKRWSMKSEVAA